jgi:hypothetical protein
MQTGGFKPIEQIEGAANQQGDRRRADHIG